MRLAFRALVVLCLFAPFVASQELPPSIGATGHRLLFYDASNNLEYVCWTQAQNGITTFTRAATTLTSITDSSNTATVVIPNHGLTAGATVTVSGATEDTDLNGTYTVATVSDVNTFTFTSANVTDAAYTEATLVVSYTGPRDTASIWAIQKFFYNASNYLVKSAWASGSSAKSRACASRATYNYR